MEFLQVDKCETSKKYIEVIENEYNLCFLQNEGDIQNRNDKLDAIVAFENDLKDITKLCESVLINKKNMIVIFSSFQLRNKKLEI